MVIPLSRTNIAALFVILFIYGWNQYLWPLLVTNTPAMTTIVIGIRHMIGNGDAQTAWHLVMATALLGCCRRSRSWWRCYVGSSKV